MTAAIEEESAADAALVPVPGEGLGLNAAALRQIMLFSSVPTIASVTLVNKQLRQVFVLCKPELVTRLLEQKVPRVAAER